MSRQILPRVMLSSLLLWQLVAGVFVHAHGMSSQPLAATSSATDADMTAHMLSREEHCADHVAMASESMACAPMDMSMDDVHEHKASHTEESARTHDSDAGCCQSVFCKCPCVQAVALPVVIPHVAAVAGIPPAPLAVVSLMHTGVSGLFRPPI